jgi:hypothetical protein
MLENVTRITNVNADVLLGMMFEAGWDDGREFSTFDAAMLTGHELTFTRAALRYLEDAGMVRTNTGLDWKMTAC